MIPMFAMELRRFTIRGFTAMAFFGILSCGDSSGTIETAQRLDHPDPHGLPIYRDLFPDSLKAAHPGTLEFHHPTLAASFTVSDWQPLERGGAAGEYGAQLLVAAFRGLESLNRATDFDGVGKVVAMLSLERTLARPLEEYYPQSKYPDGALFCLYLRRRSGDWQWGVVQAQGGPRCPTPGSVGGWNGDVYWERVEDPRTRQPFPADSYPNAARLEEYKKKADGTHRRSIVVAVRCGDAVCHMGTDSVSFLAGREHLTDPGNVPSARSLIPLYFDDQVLAEFKDPAQPKKGLRLGTLRAQVIPEDTIGKIVHSAEHRVVARVFLAAPPSGKYATYLQQGWTDVRVWKEGNDYYAETRRVDAQGNERISDRMLLRHTPMGERMPGTIRWAWGNDEGIWIPCDMGCCEASNE
jgi:hypothetical protein